MAPYREDIAITPRKVAFDWSEVPMHFVPDEPFASQGVNAFHILLPAGENWFCQVYAEAIPYLGDNPKLKADAIAFMRQEAMHSRAHAGVLDYFAQNNVDVRAVSKEIEARLKRFAGDKIYGLITPRGERMKRWWLLERLAVVAAVEHFTCVLSVWLFEKSRLEQAGAHPQMLDLLHWHCAEEIEHRNVAFDIYTHLAGGGHFRRYRQMISTIFGLHAVVRLSMKHLLAADASYQNPPSFHKGWNAAARKGLLPPLWDVLKSTVRWFSRRYDPQIEADTQTALDYFARSPVLNGPG